MAQIEGGEYGAGRAPKRISGRAYERGPDPIGDAVKTVQRLVSGFSIAPPVVGPSNKPKYGIPSNNIVQRKWPKK